MTGIAAGLAALAGVSLGWWGVLAVATVAGGVFAIRRQHLSPAVCLLAVAVAMVGAWRGGGTEALVNADLVSVATESVEVVSAPAQTGQHQHFVARVSAAERESGAAPPVSVCVTSGAVPSVQLGDELRLTGELRFAVDSASGGRAWMAVRGCDAALFASSAHVVRSTASPARMLAELRTRLGENLRRAAPGDAGVLLAGLVTGDDSGLSPQREEAFIRTGTTHLTAVSGSNLALVAGILAALGAATVGRHRIGWQVVTVASVWSYALISGAHAPAVRAAIVATAAILAFRFGRKPDFPTLILLAAGTMALIDPRQVATLGFRLSVVASLALAIVLPGMMSQDRGSRLAMVIAATAAAQIATAPMLIATFGAVSLASLPANVAAAPLAVLAMPIAALAAIAGLLWPPLGEAIAAPAVALAGALIEIVDRLGASQGYVSVGVPPLAVAAAFAVTGWMILFLLSGSVTTMVTWPASVSLDRALAKRRSGSSSRLAGTTLGPLPAAAPWIFGRENPANALAADADNSEE